MNPPEDNTFQIGLLTSLLLVFSSCAWLIPFVAVNEELTFEMISLRGETWYVGIGLSLWFSYGSYLVTMAESSTEESRLTRGMYFKKILMVPFAPFLKR